MIDPVKFVNQHLKTVLNQLNDISNRNTLRTLLMVAKDQNKQEIQEAIDERLKLLKFTA